MLQRSKMDRREAPKDGKAPRPTRGAAGRGEGGRSPEENPMPTPTRPKAARAAAAKIAPVARVAEVKAPEDLAEEPVADVAAAPAVAPPAAPTIADPQPAPVPARKTMEKTMTDANKAAESMMKAAEQMAEFGRGNVEAFTKAAQLYVTGVQDLGKHTVTVMQGLTDHAIEGAKALSTVKSLQEAAQVQTTYARGAIEKVVSESAKMQEAALKLAEQSFAPLSARMTVAVEKFSRPLAA